MFARVKDLIINILNQENQIIESQSVIEYSESHSELSLSQQGLYFEHYEIMMLLRKFKGFATVFITDARGNELTEEIIDVRAGADGGIDCVIHVNAPTDRGLKWAITRVTNIIVNKEYLD